VSKQKAGSGKYYQDILEIRRTHQDELSDREHNRPGRDATIVAPDFSPGRTNKTTPDPGRGPTPAPS